VIKSDNVPAVPEETIPRPEGSSYVPGLVKNENDLYFLTRTKADAGRLSRRYSMGIFH